LDPYIYQNLEKLSNLPPPQLLKKNAGKKKAGEIGALRAIIFPTPLKFFVRFSRDSEILTCHLQKFRTWSVNAAVLATPAVILQMVPQFSIWLNKQH